MPLYNWDECTKGNVKWVHKYGVSTLKDNDKFEVLQDQYIKRYGIGEALEEHLTIKQVLTTLRLMYVETGDKMLLNQIAIEEANLIKTDPNLMEGRTTDQALAWLRTKVPTWIDKKIITIVEFRELLDEYGSSREK